MLTKASGTAILLGMIRKLQRQPTAGRNVTPRNIGRKQGRVIGNTNSMNNIQLMIRKGYGLLALLLLALVGGVQESFAAAASATSITTTATTAFEAVTVLVVAMVGFFIVVRIVKGIRK